MKIVHAADLHIDSPLRGLSKLEGVDAERVRLATRVTFERLIETCLEDEVDLLVLAGDVFDGDWRDMNTGTFFARQIGRLNGVTEVVLVKGNHDAASVVTREVRWPDNLKVLPHRKPGTFVFEDLGVAVHGQSFAKRAVHENLALGYPDPVPGLLNLGLLHTNANGSAAHGSYAECTLSDLVDGRPGYDYWALGHIHAAEVLRDGAPWVVYPGNLQGRSARETGPKGYVEILVEEGEIVAVEPRTIDAIRWLRVEVDVRGVSDEGEVLDRCRSELEDAYEEVAQESDPYAGDRIVLARVVLAGETPLHARLLGGEGELRAKLEGPAASIGRLWLEKVKVETQAPAPAADAEAAELLGLLREEVAGILADEEQQAILRAGLEKLEKHTRRFGAWRLDAEPDPESSLEPRSLEDYLQDAEGVLANLLAGPGGEVE